MKEALESRAWEYLAWEWMDEARVREAAARREGPRRGRRDALDAQALLDEGPVRETARAWCMGECGSREAGEALGVSHQTWLAFARDMGLRPLPSRLRTLSVRLAAKMLEKAA